MNIKVAFVKTKNVKIEIWCPLRGRIGSNVDFDLLVSAEAELVLAEGHFTFVRMSELL